MSASQAERSSAPGSGNIALDTVFCHECQNEWKRDVHGLTCPRCGSDFTEIIEPDNDPRAPSIDEPQPLPEMPSTGAPHPLFGHNPWADDDSDDGDMSRVEISTGPGGISYTRTTFRPPGQPVPPLLVNFQTILQNIMGPQFPAAVSGVPVPRSTSSPPGNAFSPQPGSPGSSERAQGDGRPPGSTLGGGNAQNQRSGNRMGGPQYFYTSGRIFSRDMNNAPPQANDIGGFISMLLQPPNQMPGRPLNPEQDHGQMPVNPFAFLLSTLLNPAAAQQGDAVYTQEALDRVISQLMEQHQSGNAPGPASEAAIASLPKKKVDEAMLSDGAADCSICMDEVHLGEEVTELPCHHWFHEQCIGAWLREHDTCPHCRAGIMPKDGSANRARAPGQEALYTQDLSTGAPEGSRMNPIILGGPNDPSGTSAPSNGQQQNSSSSPSGTEQGQMPGSPPGTGGGLEIG